MQCPKCKSAMSARPLDEKTTQQVCNGCGYSQVVESAGGVPTGRQLLTDDMPVPSGRPLNG